MIWLRTEMKTCASSWRSPVASLLRRTLWRRRKQRYAPPAPSFAIAAPAPEMVVLPAGSFTMGSSAEEKIVGGKPWQ